MNEQTETKANQPSAAMGLLLAPLAVLLALATTQVVGIEYDLTANNMMPMLVVAIASMLAVVPRIVRESVPDLSTSTVSLGVLVVAFVGAEALYMFAGVDAFAALMFAVIVLVGSNLDMRGRHEWMTALAFGAVGFWLALAAASDAYSALTAQTVIGDLTSIIQLDNGASQPEYRSTINLERQAAAYVFFAYLTLSVAAGLLAGVLARGNLNPAGEEGWFSFLGPRSGFNRAALPLMGALTMWVVAFAISIWHFNSVGVVRQTRCHREPELPRISGLLERLLDRCRGPYCRRHGGRALVYTSHARGFTLDALSGRRSV